MPTVDDWHRHIGARFTLEEAAQIEAIAEHLRRERPGSRISLSDALRFCVSSAAATLGAQTAESRSRRRLRVTTKP